MTLAVADVAIVTLAKPPWVRPGAANDSPALRPVVSGVLGEVIRAFWGVTGAFWKVVS